MAIDDELSPDERAQVRAKLYDFVSDPMNRQNPELERARRLLGKMSKAQAPEAMSPQPRPPVDENPTGPRIGGVASNFMSSERYPSADMNDPAAMEELRKKTQLATSELENDIVAQGIVGDAMARPVTAGLGMGLNMLLGKTRAGEAAQFLRARGEPMSPPPTRFDEAGIFEATKPGPGVAEAQQALQFKAPNHLVHAHAMMTPLSLLFLAAKNAGPLAGRVGVPMARAVEEGALQAPALETTVMGSRR